ncbi:MAG: 2-hydroxyacyl-CoA dehydratase [Firmicutes bacterium]|nr:2-hydroxyacyl-CoA dehydratase [Bacillota bacterium]
MEVVGITTTVPIEVLLASKVKVIDLNNIFITSKNYNNYIDIAEREGFPKSSCAWIKGIFGACIKNNIKKVIGVMEGDCSNTKALVNILKLKGIKVYEFKYPSDRKKENVKLEIDKFMDIFDVDINEVERVRDELKSVRKLVKKIDLLTYKENKATGFENHLYQVSSSDFNGDFKKYKKELLKNIKKIKKRKPNKNKLRLGYIGVPPMVSDIYEFVESFNGRIVFNEVQREFSFPRISEANNIYDQYYYYTYPYDINYRISEIKNEIDKRKLDGLIHYTQAFCYRAIDDIYIKNKIDIPILTIEGDKSNVLDARTKLRIEAFLDMLSDRKGVV